MNNIKKIKVVSTGLSVTFNGMVELLDGKELYAVVSKEGSNAAVADDYCVWNLYMGQFEVIDELGDIEWK